MGLCPLTLDQGLCPWTPLGAPPPTLVIGSRSVLAMCVHTTFFDLTTPLLALDRFPDS